MSKKNQVLLVEQIRQLEKEFIDSTNNTFAQVLMELAGYGAYKEIEKLFSNKKFNIIASNGNNGGDGLVLARYLIENKKTVTVNLIKTKEEFTFKTTEASLNFKLLQTTLNKCSKHISAIKYISKVDDLDINNSDIIVDAIFGTGLNQGITGLYADIIDKINTSNKYIIALDISSGINGNTGQIMKTAVKANRTFTFGYYKPGLFCHPGASLSGKTTLIDIGLPKPCELKPDIKIITSKMVKKLLPVRANNSHKGSFGSLITIGTSLGMLGSGYLSAFAALKAGCGLSYLAVPDRLIDNVPVCELIYYPLPSTDKASISSQAVNSAIDYLQYKSAVVIGPGLSQHQETKIFLIKLLELIKSEYPRIPKLLDADALNILSSQINFDLGPNTVITPHPKEMARLLKISVSEVQADRLNTALMAAKLFNCTVVLKGHNTIIADYNENIFINTLGSSALAKAGSGDVLSGIIGSFLAQGVNCLNSSILGVYLHSLAGDLASQEYTEYSTLPTNIIKFLPKAINLRLNY